VSNSDQANLDDLRNESLQSENQLPIPPEPPNTHDEKAWASYRDVWEAYIKAWERDWQAQGKSQYFRRPNGSEFYEDAWLAHWDALGQPWRILPEINEQRQQFLAERCTIIPAPEKGSYPFTDIKLDRDDIEWLLARHDNGLGPIRWTETQREPDDKEDFLATLYGRYMRKKKRKGLDLRGADLRGTDLSNLFHVAVGGARGLPGIRRWRSVSALPRRVLPASAQARGRLTPACARS
jgi:hypothetical protein